MQKKDILITKLLQDLQDYNDNLPEPCQLLQSIIKIYARKAKGGE
jgi:hypothetical protein